MRLRCNAKLNLSLDIVGRRADGYHLLDSVMQSVSLFDVITVLPSDSISVDCSLKELSGENNIAFTAAKRFFEASGIGGGAEIYIEKHIPHTAGLGGGSADAAGVLKGLNVMFGQPFDDMALKKIALSLGADVPFCLFGGTLRAGGVGEELYPLKPLEKGCFVIVKSGVKQSTGDMYKALDAVGELQKSTEKTVSALEKGKLSEIAESLYNVFLTVCDVSGQKKAFEETRPLGFSLSGSGPAVFGVYPDEVSARLASEKLKTAGFEPIIATPEKAGIIIE